MAFSIELPTPNDPPEVQREKLDKMADTFGTEEFFNFKRYLTDNKNTEVSRFHEQQAARLLRKEMADDPTISFDQARRRLAHRLGYKELTRTNFYKLINAGLVLINSQSLKRRKGKKPRRQRQLATVD